MIRPGKLQLVFIWREKLVLLALLNNLTIPALSSYPVFRTKWFKISLVIFCGTIFSQIFPTKSARTMNMKISCDPEAEAGSLLCCPSPNILNLRGGAQLFPRHTTCLRSHNLLVSSCLRVPPLLPLLLWLVACQSSSGTSRGHTSRSSQYARPQPNSS